MGWSHKLQRFSLSTCSIALLYICWLIMAREDEHSLMKPENDSRQTFRKMRQPECVAIYIKSGINRPIEHHIGGCIIDFIPVSVTVHRLLT